MIHYNFIISKINELKDLIVSFGRDLCGLFGWCGDLINHLITEHPEIYEAIMDIIHYFNF